MFDPSIDGMTLSFAWDGEARVDDETSSRWNLAGRAIKGPLLGTQLGALRSRTAFWSSNQASFDDMEIVRK